MKHAVKTTILRSWAKVSGRLTDNGFMNAIEKRKNPRIDALSLVSYTRVDEEGRPLGRGMGRTLNISGGGILLETHAPVDPLDILGLDIGLRDEMINLRGRVIYNKPEASDVYEVGIRFLDARGPDLRVLSHFVNVFHARKDQ